MKKFFLVTMLIFLSAQVIFADESMSINVSNTNISVYPGWLLSYTKSPTTYIVYSPLEKNDNFRESYNLVIEPLSKSCSVKQYIDITIAQINIAYGDFKLIERGDYYMIYSGILNNMHLKQMQFFTIKNNTAYILTFSSLASDFSRYQNTFLEIEKTFTVD